MHTCVLYPETEPGLDSLRVFTPFPPVLAFPTPHNIVVSAHVNVYASVSEYIFRSVMSGMHLMCVCVCVYACVCGGERGGGGGVIVTV